MKKHTVKFSVNFKERRLAKKKAESNKQLSVAEDYAQANGVSAEGNTTEWFEKQVDYIGRIDGYKQRPPTARILRKDPNYVSLSLDEAYQNKYKTEELRLAYDTGFRLTSPGGLLGRNNKY